ncbi:MAG: ferrous iron transport protein A [Micropruina sp.]|nr:MAG: ferrous iron transport protein A [Micropruina sp.]
MTTLAQAPLHTPLTVVADTRDGVVGRRLAMLGIRRGATLSVVSTSSGGGRVVSVAGSRIALGRDALTAVSVEEAGA